MSVGVLSIWSVGWEPAGVSSPGPRQWWGAREATGRRCLQKLTENSPVLLPDMAKGPSFPSLDVCYSVTDTVFSCAVGAWTPWALPVSRKPSSTLAAGAGAGRSSPVNDLSTSVNDHVLQ